jgi:2'-5' RNA ligase
LFVAVHLPPAETERLYRETESLRESRLPVRWVALPSLHITLKFLGEVADARVAQLTEILARTAAAHPPFTLSVHGIGAFPNLRRPRVLWVGTDSAPELLTVQDAVEMSLAELGFEREARAWSPHLTLGRAQEGAHAAAFAALPALADAVTYESTVEIRTIDLMRSRLQRGGAQYERLIAAPLLARGAVSTGKDPKS